MFLDTVRIRPNESPLFVLANSQGKPIIPPYLFDQLLQWSVLDGGDQDMIPWQILVVLW